MEWIYNTLLMPVLTLLYHPCDWLLGWSLYFPPVVSISIVGVISGIAVIAVQKWGSDQKFLGQAKADLNLLKLKMKAAKQAGDNDALTRARGLSGKIGGKYMVSSLKPSLWTVPLLAVIGLWTGSRLGFLPVRPGDEVTIAAHFEDNAKGFAYVLPTPEFKPVGALISPVAIPHDGGGIEARWKLRAEQEGASTLTIRHGERSYEIPIPVARRGGRPPEPVTVVNHASPGQDQLQAVEIKLAPSLPVAWWNLTLQWGGLYLLTAVGLALGLRFLLKVN
jgi:uncharacterized membrane protein (DUF106 family)